MSSNEVVEASTAVAEAVELPVALPKKRMVKRRPARRQVEQGQIVRKAPEQTGQTFNVWYGKWTGGDRYDSYNVQEKAQTRVVIDTDTGYTRADGTAMTYCCLFFARGCCPAGSDCTYLHRLPPPAVVLPDTSRDVFNREKHADYRDDMGGIGSFSRINRTIYIGRIKETRNTAEMVERHFEEFGEIERIKILAQRGVAFVTYFSELNAQFAKEAMTDQSLDSDEIINVRWSTEDPNPAAIRRNKRHLKQLGESGIASALDPEFVQAVREMDELEERVGPKEISTEYDDADVRSSKRGRIGGSAEQMQMQVPAVTHTSAPPAPPTTTARLLSADALESLKLLPTIAKPASVPVSASKPIVGGLGGLADYGSDDDDE